MGFEVKIPMSTALFTHCSNLFHTNQRKCKQKLDSFKASRKEVKQRRNCHTRYEYARGEGGGGGVLENKDAFCLNTYPKAVSYTSFAATTFSVRVGFPVHSEDLHIN